MKKFISILSIFLFLSFNINTTTTMAQEKRFKEGFYSTTNLGLLENVSYKVQNVSDYNGFIIVFDSDQKIQQAISLEPHSIQHPLKTIRSTDRVIILGKGELIFPY
ncbi:hypothetical protein psyc5s11_33270 [Clostridium gelidum]|uniref:Uncharacterized protein n=1 Tax=Clostridium gelidum TaxID=704125 RepID=A0ABN6IYP6_9CLOT|nr:hypothetical protein [Clostridium gelidum]BCZ47260.1 hypothetical protein psyc5s11_33270 [Clostridium gelidum]